MSFNLALQECKIFAKWPFKLRRLQTLDVKAPKRCEWG